METKIVEKQLIHGISARTNNALETSPRGKIPELWQRFDESIPVDYQHGERVYGVYYDYESDHNGMFTVLAGFDGKQCPSTVDVEQITILEGKYLVFTQKGNMPQIAVKAWEEVWEYFSREDCEHQRLFTTDFEYYPNDNEIAVHIAIE